MESSVERRHNLRVALQATVRLSAPGRGRPFVCSGQTRNLSLRGFYFCSATILPAGTSCDVELKLSGSTTELSLRMKGVVVRADTKGMAVLFQELDVDSLFHLRNILCDKGGDPARIDSELPPDALAVIGRDPKER